MGKYSNRTGTRRAVEKFTKWQGVGILVVIGGILVTLLLLWMFGYLHFDWDSSAIRSEEPGFCASAVLHYDRYKRTQSERY